MNILHISDTHGFHRQIEIPENIDMIICTGDAGNQKDPYQNEWEMKDFLMWYESIKVKYKVYIPGNHDTSIERGLIKKLDFLSRYIHLLNHDWIEIEGIKIFGSPYTPTFGDWSFMKDRSKLYRLWEQIPENMDIIAVHGPCKGILDLSYNRQNELEFCGDSALGKIVRKLEPKLFLSGHIHNCEDIVNTGIRKIQDCKTIFSNAAAVTDRKFDLGITFNGNILKIN